MLIIDGHNLIPKMPGLSLQDMDDETALISRLQLYARVRRKQVLVFFDGAPPGQTGWKTYGLIRAFFVAQGRTADDAIRQFLDEKKRGASPASVVSSDRTVQANARECGALVITSEDFARDMLDARAEMDFQSAKARGKRRGAPAADGAPGGVKLDEWYELFGVDPAQAEKPIEPPSGKKRRRASPSEPKPAQGSAQRANEKPASKPGGKKQRHGFPPKLD